MHSLFKFAKRNTTELFTPRYGKSRKIYDHNCKFLFDRYGTMRHYYSPSTEYAIIEADIKNLISE